MPIAPYQVLITPILYKDVMQEYADKFYDELRAEGIEVLLDDRDERAGVKFKDADLLGIPLRITVGDRKLKEGKVELKRRRDGEMWEVPLEELTAKIKTLIAEEMVRKNPEE